MRSKSHHNQPEIAISMVTNPEINNKRKGMEDEARTKELITWYEALVTL